MGILRLEQVKWHTNSMMHPDTSLQFVNDLVGVGVFASQFIPKGTITWTLDELDQHLDPTYVAALEPLRKAVILKYAYRNCIGQYVLCWDLGRYINHSSKPNTMSTAYNCDIAIRDIYLGEQLTCDYGCLNLEEPFYCLPETGTERVEILPDDLLRFADQWDQLVEDAMHLFQQVEQPLLPLLQSHSLERIHAVASEGSRIDSLRSQHYFPTLPGANAEFGHNSTLRRQVVVLCTTP